MDKLSKNLNTLKTLSCCRKRIKDNLIKRGKKDLINSVCECVLNTLNGKIKLTKKDTIKLSKFKYSLRKLLKKKSQKDKKKIIIQEGGFLQILLPSAIALITSILNNRKK